jgi:hypothetical protein
MSEYDVKYLGRQSVEVRGDLLLFSDKVVFKPKKEYAEKMKRELLRPCHAHGLTDCPYCGETKKNAYTEYTKKIEILIDKIKDARFATEEDISALRVWLVGPVLGTLWRERHKILVIDFEDEFGIVQHLAFEGNDMEEAIEELYEIRKAGKLKGKSALKELK